MYGYNQQWGYKKRHGIPKHKAAAIYPMDEPNLLKYSEDFSSAAWTKTAGLSVTPGFLGPDNMIAFLLQDSSASVNESINQVINVAVGTTDDYTVSFYLKQGTAAETEIDIISRQSGTPKTQANAKVNWSNKTVNVIYKKPSDLAASCAMTEISDGYYRVSLTAPCSALADTILVWLYPSTYATGGTTTGSVYATGAMINRGTLKPYRKTTDLQQITSSPVPFYWILEGGNWVKKRYRGVNLLMPNQATAEDGNTVGVNKNRDGTTVSSTTEKSRTGNYSFKVACDGTLSAQGLVISPPYVPATPGETFYVSAYASGLLGGEKVFLYINELNASGSWLRGSGGSLVTLSADGFQRLFHSKTVGEDCAFVNFTIGPLANTAATFYVDDLQIERDELTEWEPPLPHGYNGSTPAVDVNDGTWNGQGLLLGAAQYGSLPMIPPGYGADIIFALENAVDKDTTKKTLIGIKSKSGVFLGSVTGYFGNEIITVYTSLEDDGYEENGVASWCSDTESIPPGCHLLQINFDGTEWAIVLDGVSLPISITGWAGMLRPFCAGASTLGKSESTYLGDMVNYFVPYAIPRTPAEIVASARYLRAEMIRRGVTPNW